MDSKDGEELPRVPKAGVATSTHREAGAVLGSFLEAGLIDVGGDDAKFENLRHAAIDLAGRLLETPMLFAEFMAAACDPYATATHTAIEQAGVALRARWATFRNTFRDTPVGVLRAVLLDALASAALGSDLLAAAFASTARNRLPLVQASNEEAIWAAVIARAERQLEARARREWATPGQLPPPDFDIEPPEPISVGSTLQGVDKDSLAKLIAAAVGPQNNANQPTQGNPNWPNGGPAWAFDFAPRMADAINAALKTAGKTLDEQELDLGPLVAAVATAVRGHTAATFEGLSTATAGLGRRTDLIWWRQSLYSPSAMISYRELSHSGAAALMAYDVHLLVPTFSPGSVTAFLREAVHDLPAPAANQTSPIRELMAEVATHRSLGPIREIARRLFASPVPGGPLLGIVGHLGSGQLPEDDAFRTLVRLDPGEPLTIQRWSEWIFCELQAARAIREAAEASATSS